VSERNVSFAATVVVFLGAVAATTAGAAVLFAFQSPLLATASATGVVVGSAVLARVVNKHQH